MTTERAGLSRQRSSYHDTPNGKPVPLQLLTVGHGTLPAEALAELVRGAGIELIVDVRTVPKSRRQPQYWREQMERWVPELADSAYRWEPALGGFRKPQPGSLHVALRHPAFQAYADYMETDTFENALAMVLATAGEKRTAILCSESLWWRCHRRLISDAAALLHDVAVQHLMHDGTLRPHILTAGVRAASGTQLIYDVPEIDGQQLTLL